MSGARRCRGPARAGVRGSLVLATVLASACGDGPAPQADAAEGVQAAAPATAPEGQFLAGEFWRDQGLRDVLPYWTRHARDEEYGAFFAELDRDWTPQGDLHKHPGMISRHLFSYATAYLLTGDDAHLEMADEVLDYLIEYGWDHESGGWYDELDRSGAVVDSGKDLFNQAYAVTGLAMYYFVTHDQRARHYLERSVEILDTHAWDEQHGGFVRSLARDLSVAETRKDFSPQIAPVSGYLAYLYPATREPRYLRRMEQILGLVVARTRDPETGWVTGQFDEDWTPRKAREETRINVGHNLETAWLLMRLHLHTGNAAYRETALELGDEMLERAFQTETGAWAHQLHLSDGSLARQTTPWWVQAYGNMVQLYQYRLTGDSRHLEAFRAGSSFWNHAFMDPRYGATYLTVTLDGEIDRPAKGVRTKTSYHAMEYALLNYLYLNLWIADEPAELHFRIEDPQEGHRLHPSPLEDPDVRIAEVEINGQPWDRYDADAVILPDSGPLRIRVRLHIP